MSGDVQPRKRNKDKRFKKKEPNLTETHLPQKSVKKDDDLDFDETNIHVQKDIKFGGNIISKVFFSLVFGALICMVGIIVLEHRGSGNEVQSSTDSPWSQMLEGWIEDKVDTHDGHDVDHDDHEDDEDHDHEDDDHDHQHNDDHEEEDDDDDDHHDDTSGEDLVDDHVENDDEHSEEHEAEEIDNDEAGIFSGFVQKYIQPSLEEEEIDEEGVFTGFINKYIYTSEAAARDKKEKEDEEDEGYDSQDDKDDRKDVDDDLDEDDNDRNEDDNDRDEDDNDRDEDDNDRDEDDNDRDEDDEQETEDDDDAVKYKTSNRRYIVQDDDVSRELDEDDELNSKEEQVTEDWRKIVYRAPAPKEEEEEDDNDAPSYASYHYEEEDDRELDEKNDSGEKDDEDKDDEDKDKYDDDSPVAHDELDDNLSEPDQDTDNDEETLEEEEGAGNPALEPPTPLPPLSQDPRSIFVEEITPLPPLEEEPHPPPYVDRRATLVETLPSDVEESDFGEYEEEEEELSQQSDVEPTRESTLVTFEYSPVDTEHEEEEEEEEEEEKSDNDSAPINDQWAGVSRSPREVNSEDEELAGDTGSELEYSDNEPVGPVAPQPRYGGPKSVDEDYLLADITNDQDWAIRRELDAAEALYNGSHSSH